MPTIVALALLSAALSPFSPASPATSGANAAEIQPSPAPLAFYQTSDDAYFYDAPNNNGPCHAHAFFYNPNDNAAKNQAAVDCAALYKETCQAYHMSLKYLGSRAC
jgi:hypothetical protein